MLSSMKSKDFKAPIRHRMFYPPGAVMRSSVKILIALLVWLMIAPCCADSSSLRLIENGKSRYVMIVPVQASPEEMRAAVFLNHHLEMMTGYRLPVIEGGEPWPEHCVVIRKSDSITSGDGYQVTTTGRRLVIRGGSERGCVYGVAELLETHLGVRYYSPAFVVAPKKSKITIPRLHLAGSSPNTYRNVHGRFAEDANYKDFHRLHSISDMFADGYYVHTFHRLVPWRELMAKHPEYFALVNGKRSIHQLCLSNPDVLRLVTEKLQAEMALQPGKKVWSVSQDDNPWYCECPECSRVIGEERSAAGPIVRFVNQVASQFPDKIISTLAYIYSRKAPMQTRPRKNVQVMLCTIELNRSLPIAADSASRSFIKDIEDWGRISDHIYLWDYTVDFAHSISPFPNLHVLQPNIQLFVRNNVKEHFQQSNTGAGHEFSELKSYLLAKLLWNPQAHADSIIREFTDGYYGPAAPWIRKYLYRLQNELLKSGERLDIYGPPNNHQHSFLSAANVSAYNTWFDEAEKAVAAHPDYLLHVRKARMPLQYAIMEIGKGDMFGPRGWYEEKHGDFVPKAHMTETLERFYQTSMDCKSEPLNESGLTAEEYYFSTRRFIQSQVKGNLAFRKPVEAAPPPEVKYSCGNLSYLTNGVRGANDYHVHWIGWESKNFRLRVDLQQIVKAESIEISTLWDAKSWILHPKSMECLISADGTGYRSIGKQTVEGDQQNEPIQRLFTFRPSNGQAFRFAEFVVTGTLQLPLWHHAAGGGSWVFVDEIVIK